MAGDQGTDRSEASSKLRLKSQAPKLQCAPAHVGVESLRLLGSEWKKWGCAAIQPILMNQK